MRSLLCFVILSALLAKVYAAIGPTAQLVVTNRYIAPDGYPREYVTRSPCCLCYHRLCLLCSASLVNDVFPGPLITGNKVNLSGRFFELFFEAALVRATTFRSMSLMH